ncbi:MAG: efflux RND transporter periplasmic adaptor subunit [Alphaproteobacteria bacterium GM202ARS2]|nr:efflux RND transporter periplasmic adaptor subunit [Alphaproteobacteria bacterium GM202ARS2]
MTAPLTPPTIPKTRQEARLAAQTIKKRAEKQWAEHSPSIKKNIKQGRQFIIKNQQTWQSPPFIVGAIATLSVLWILSGSKEPLTKLSTEVIIPSVTTELSRALPHRPKIILRGQTEASRRVNIRARTNGNVSQVLHEKGQPIFEDDTILTIDIEDLEEKKQEAEARLQEADIQYQASERLISRGHRSQVNDAQIKTRYRAALAALSTIDNEIRHKTLSAPFDGVLATRTAEIGSYLKQGDDVAMIVDLHPLLITAEVSENDRQNLHLDTPVTAILSDDTQLEGAITYIAPSANPNTRTFRIEADADNPEQTLPEGLSAEIHILKDETLAHLIKPSTLNIDDKGIIGIKAVNDKNQIVFYPITIIDESPEGLWVTGPPSTITVVTVGQDFVIPGQTVRAFPAERASPLAENSP